MEYIDIDIGAAPTLMLNLQRVGAVFFKQLPAETENRTFKEVIHMYTANAQLLEAFNKEHEYLKTKLDLGARFCG